MDTQHVHPELAVCVPRANRNRNIDWWDVSQSIACDGVDLLCMGDCSSCRALFVILINVLGWQSLENISAPIALSNIVQFVSQGSASFTMLSFRSWQRLVEDHAQSCLRLTRE